MGGEKKDYNICNDCQWHFTEITACPETPNSNVSKFSRFSCGGVTNQIDQRIWFAPSVVRAPINNVTVVGGGKRTCEFWCGYQYWLAITVSPMITSVCESERQSSIAVTGLLARTHTHTHISIGWAFHDLMTSHGTTNYWQHHMGIINGVALAWTMISSLSGLVAFLPRCAMHTWWWEMSQ